MTCPSCLDVVLFASEAARQCQAHNYMAAGMWLSEARCAAKVVRSPEERARAARLLEALYDAIEGQQANYEAQVAAALSELRRSRPASLRVPVGLGHAE